jgi:uncharacterized repeat protein (TIGR03803 family)
LGRFTFLNFFEGFRPLNPHDWLKGHHAMKKSVSVRTIILAIGLGLTTPDRVRAQTFTVLHSFTARPFVTNYDGAYPAGRLIADASGNTLYGTANLGGDKGFGTVFSLNTDGTGLKNLHSFNYFTEGSQPLGGLVLSGNTLFGTTWQGGTSGNGAVFAVHTDGTGFTNLYDFTARSGPLSTNSDGANSRAGLVMSSSGNTLYGTAENGGGAGYGTIFKVNTNGTGFTTLHGFTALSGPSNTNSDGIRPNSRVILSGNTLYGSAIGGGSFGRGTVFKVNTDGAGFTTLHSFNGSDGAGPFSGLLLSGTTLYGTTRGGGIFDQGTVFALNTNGTDFTTLLEFTSSSDGVYPTTDLILSGDSLYGTTAGSAGTVFALRTDGTGFTNLYSLDYASEGSGPSVLILLGNTLYGVASSGGAEGGSTGNGTVFSLSFNPQLTIIPSGADVVLTWPTNVAGFDYTGFTLQSTTNPISPVWSSNSLSPTVVNGQNTITNPASEAQRFFRLKSP